MCNNCVCVRKIDERDFSLGSPFFSLGAGGRGWARALALATFSMRQETKKLTLSSFTPGYSHPPTHPPSLSEYQSISSRLCLGRNHCVAHIAPIKPKPPPTAAAPLLPASCALSTRRRPQCSHAWSNMRCHLPVATVAPSPPAPDKIARSGKRQSTTDGELFLVDAISRYGFVILNKELHRVTMELRVLFSADKKKFSRNWWQISRCLQAAKNLTPTFAIYFANRATQGYPVN